MLALRVVKQQLAVHGLMGASPSSFRITVRHMTVGLLAVLLGKTLELKRGREPKESDLAIKRQSLRTKMAPEMSKTIHILTFHISDIS